jgi:phosphatidate cytidylyltransferase
MIGRIVTSTILVPASLAAIFFAPPWLFLAVVALLALVCFHEYCDITASHGIVRPTIAVYLAGLLFLVFPQRDVEMLTLATLILMATSLYWQDLKSALPSAGASLLGLFYCFGAWSCGAKLHAISPYWLILALAVNWIGDTVALYAGRTFGKHKLAPRISPAKSWEGAIASTIVSSLLGAFFIQHFFQWHLVDGFFLTAFANVAGQIGDLAESGIKRGAKVKDSSRLLPGHGGWLDRLDSSLFSMPTVYFFVGPAFASIKLWVTQLF